MFFGSVTGEMNYWKGKVEALADILLPISSPPHHPYILSAETVERIGEILSDIRLEREKNFS